MLRTLKSHGSVLDSFTNIHLAAPAPCSHLLQFYADDDQLLDRLEEFVYFGLKGREACIIFATAAHLAELRTRLAARNVDAERAKNEGLLIELDAHAGLDLFMKDGSPDRERFGQATGELVTSARGNGRRVRVFGEMVVILWNNGQHEAAVCLERLGNDLMLADDVTLLCAYPSHAHENDPSELIHDVYAAHTALVL
jgi:hypothetical protein